MAYNVQSLSDMMTHVNTVSVLSKFVEYIRLHVGEYKFSCRDDDFLGWMRCDGRSLSRSTYKDLYEIIGTNFGSNDGLTFNIPDYRGRVFGIVGEGDGLTSRTIGQMSGAETHTLTSNELPGHTHTGTTASDGLHSHTGSTSTNGAHNHGGSTGAAGGHTHTNDTNTTTKGLATINGFSTTTELDDTNNGELNLRTLETLTIDAVGDHSHTITSGGDHSHTVTTDANGSHTHIFTTDITGSNVAHNIMQPTLFGGNVFIFSGVVAPSV